MKFVGRIYLRLSRRKFESDFQQKIPIIFLLQTSDNLVLCEVRSAGRGAKISIPMLEQWFHFPCISSLHLSLSASQEIVLARSSLTGRTLAITFLINITAGIGSDGSLMIKATKWTRLVERGEAKYPLKWHLMAVVKRSSVCVFFLVIVSAQFLFARELLIKKPRFDETFF